MIAAEVVGTLANRVGVLVVLRTSLVNGVLVVKRDIRTLKMTAYRCDFTPGAQLIILSELGSLYDYSVPLCS